MATMDISMSGSDEFQLPARKKPKISELPLSSAQRASVDGMLHTFKKKGEFDALRKKAFQQYNESAQRGMFENALRTFTTNEIDRDSLKYLKPQARIAAPLIEGAAARADIYVKTENDIDAYIDQYIANAEKTLREIRRLEIGDDAADEELRRGKKTDEAYAAEAEQRRQERAKKHADEERKRRKQEAQERKKKELEALKKKQEALQKETERLQREQKRRAERDAWKAAEKERERERIRKFNEERERLKKEAEERERLIQEERERRQKERAEREQKRLEAEALDLLLREGQEMAEKARRPELERSESMEPPPRLKHQSAPRTNYGKEQMRAQGLMPTSLTLRKGDKVEIPTDQITATSGDPETGRPYHPRSPSPARSSYSNRRRDPSSDDRRRPRDRRESLYRDISTEREAWKARQRGGDRDRDRPRSRSKGRDRPHASSRLDEDGEVVERQARSRSPDGGADVYRPRRDDSRSPPRRSYRDRTRSRSPVRRYRDRSRRRERSRSPPGIDRYVPGGGAALGGRRRDDDEAPRARRARDDEDDREKDRDRDRERDRNRERRRPRYDDRERVDRYLPGRGEREAAPTDEEERPQRRRERSRSRDRDVRGDRYTRRAKSRDRSRDRDRDKERDRKERDMAERVERRGSKASAGEE